MPVRSLAQPLRGALGPSHRLECMAPVMFMSWRMLGVQLWWRSRRESFSCELRRLIEESPESSMPETTDCFLHAADKSTAGATLTEANLMDWAERRCLPNRRLKPKLVAERCARHLRRWAISVAAPYPASG
jgi:hypothetical protein